MVILEESGSEQTIKFIQREWVSGASYTVNIVDETQNKNVYSEATTSITEDKYYNSYSGTFSNLKEGIYYTLSILSGGDVVYKDKIYCTNQSDLPAYSINNDVYTTNDTDNEFITI
jgi:hypothetical protein